MVLVDYDFYTCTYGGNLVPRSVFDGFARRAAVLLRSMILQPEDLKRTDDEKVRLLLCEICDRLYHEDGRRGISREILDGYDVSYTDDAGACEIRQLVRQSLGADGVLYRGRRL